MNGPRRLQRQRRAGWRIPPGAIYVGRPTRWGNPFPVGPQRPAEACVEAYRRWLAEPAQAGLVSAARAELVGRDLVCWCALGAPCHADVLLAVANGAAP